MTKNLSDRCREINLHFLIFETELSKKIIAGDIKEGDSVEIDFDGKKFTFNAQSEKISLDK